MTIPTNPKLTKLRILAERKEAEYKKTKELIKKLIGQSREEYEHARLEYVKACKKAGYCAVCEKPLEDCKCIVFG